MTGLTGGGRAVEESGLAGAGLLAGLANALLADVAFGVDAAVVAGGAVGDRSAGLGVEALRLLADGGLALHRLAGAEVLAAARSGALAALERDGFARRDVAPRLQALVLGAGRAGADAERIGGGAGLDALHALGAALFCF